MLTRDLRAGPRFFCNSGTEAWEGALEAGAGFCQMNHAHMANGTRPKGRILAMDNSFHGRTFGALATTGQPKYRAPFVPLMPGVKFVKFNDLEDLQRKFDASVCAVCIETIQGEGGICPVNREFLELASRLDEAERRVADARRNSMRAGTHGKTFCLSALRRVARCGDGCEAAGVRVAAGRDSHDRAGCGVHASRNAWDDVWRRSAGLRRRNRVSARGKEVAEARARPGRIFSRARSKRWTGSTNRFRTSAALG